MYLVHFYYTNNCKIGKIPERLMLVTNPPNKAGRPKRNDATDRLNLKINTNVRELLKSLATQDSRSEGAEVERLIIESYALRKLLRENQEVAIAVLPSLNIEIAKTLEAIEE